MIFNLLRLFAHPFLGKMVLAFNVLRLITRTGRLPCLVGTWGAVKSGQCTPPAWKLVIIYGLNLPSPVFTSSGLPTLNRNAARRDCCHPDVFNTCHRLYSVIQTVYRKATTSDCCPQTNEFKWWQRIHRGSNTRTLWRWKVFNPTKPNLLNGYIRMRQKLSKTQLAVFRAVARKISVWQVLLQLKRIHFLL